MEPKSRFAKRRSGSTTREAPTGVEPVYWVLQLDSRSAPFRLFQRLSGTADMSRARWCASSRSCAQPVESLR